MSVLPVGFGSSGGIDTGDIANSLRFRAAASAYLNRTPGSAGNRKKWTWSGWVKRGQLSAASNFPIFTAGANSTTNQYIQFRTDQFGFQMVNAGVDVGSKITTAILRDPSAWYHIVCVWDSANGTADDRIKIYVNGTRITSFVTSTNPALNLDSNINNNVAHAIGVYAWGAIYLDGYLSRVCFVDGSTLTPDSFGYLNADINEWVSKSQADVKAVVDAGGTNSFMLEFDDATSTTTLGYDKSTKGNNWTCNNISLTAGVTYDHMLDVPGNSYATLNPLIPSAANITNANLTSGTTAVRATMNALAFDSKWEVTAGGSAVTAGVISATGTTNTTSVTANKTFAFRLTTAGALDYRNVTDAGSWTSITTGLTGEQYPYSVTQAANWNFGQAPLLASATYQSAARGYFFDTTSGYKALCQANLPDNGTVTVSGTFTGNANADGPFVWMNGVPKTLAINGNAVTFGTHADKLANGFKVRSSSASYNTAGSNTWTATIDSNLENIFKYNNAQGNP